MSGSEPPATPAAPAIGPIHFRDCTDDINRVLRENKLLKRTLQWGCGSIAMPLDYSKPHGRSTSVTVVRGRLADQHDRIGSLLINPGGPGGSGIEAGLSLALTLPKAVVERFDIVGFDPRGVGESDPVRCISAAEHERLLAESTDAPTVVAFSAAVAEARGIAARCYANYGASLSDYNTQATARDLDRLRAALGEAKLTYLGYSYGTQLGGVYAELFPGRIRALVLDGAVDPQAPVIGSLERQTRAFEGAFDDFAADCVRQHCRLGAHPRDAVMALLARSRATPIPTSASGDSRTATDGAVLTAIGAALYDRGQWSDLAAALVRAQNGDAKSVFDLADAYDGRRQDGSYDNQTEAQIVITCADEATRPSTATIQATVASWRQKYPLFGTSQALSLLICSQWKAPAEPSPTVDVTTAAPVLVIGTTHDPATPYASAQALNADLKGSRLLTWQGDGHTAYPKTTCVADAVNAYLISLTLPAAGKTCPAS